MKFRKHSLNGFQAIVQTRLRQDFVIDKVPTKGNNSKHISARVNYGSCTRHIV